MVTADELMYSIFIYQLYSFGNVKNKCIYIFSVDTVVQYYILVFCRFKNVSVFLNIYFLCYFIYLFILSGKMLAKELHKKKKFIMRKQKLRIIKLSNHFFIILVFMIVICNKTMQFFSKFDLLFDCSCFRFK